MKNRTRTIVSIMTWLGLAAILFLPLLLLCGCASADRLLYDQQVTQRPGVILSTNIVYRTNVVVVDVARTNAATGEITPARLQQVIQPEISFSYAPPAYITNLVARPFIEGGLQTVGGLPFPFAGTAGLLLGWAYTAYRAVRNKQIGVAVMKSVEAGREFLQTTPEGVKLDEEFTRILEKHQDYSGVVREVRGLLDRYVHAAN